MMRHPLSLPAFAGLVLLLFGCVFPGSVSAQDEDETGRPYNEAENTAEIERLEYEAQDLIHKIELVGCDCDSLRTFIRETAGALKECSLLAGLVRKDLDQKIADNKKLRARVRDLERDLSNARDSITRLQARIREQDSTIAAQADSILALRHENDSLRQELNSTNAELAKNLESAMRQSIEFYIQPKYRKGVREIIIRDDMVIRRKDMRRAGDVIHARITIAGLNARFKMFYRYRTSSTNTRKRAKTIAPKPIPNVDNEEPIYLSDLKAEQQAALAKRVSGIDEFPDGRVTIEYDLDLLSRRTSDGRTVSSNENGSMQDVEATISFVVR